MSRALAFAIIFYLVTTACSAQNDIWQLTRGYQFDVATSPPKIERVNNVGKWLIYGKDSYLTDVSCSTVTDEEGKLLFYSDGYAAYNRKHDIMLNGDGLFGDLRTRQSSLIVPKIGHPNQFFLFAAGRSEAGDRDTTGLDFFPALSYSVVDMKLDNGLGGIISEQKNIPLQVEGIKGLTAIQGTCGVIWVIAASPFEKLDFYKVSADGLEKWGTYSFKRRKTTCFYLGYSYLRSANNSFFHAEICRDTSYIDVYTIDVRSGRIIDFESLRLPTFLLSANFTHDGKYIYTQEPEFDGIKMYRYLVRPTANLTVHDTKELVGVSKKTTVDLTPAGENDMYLQNKEYLGIILDASTDSPTYIESFYQYVDKIVGPFGNPVTMPVLQFKDDNWLGFKDSTVCNREVVHYRIPDDYKIIIETDTFSKSWSVDQAGEYRLTVLDKNYCERIETITISEREDCTCNVYVPNALQIGGDLGNSYWEPISNCSFNLLSFEIFDRWGGLIHKSDLKNMRPWDGTVNGERINSGVFTYSVKYSFEGESKISRLSGSITVIK